MAHNRTPCHACTWTDTSVVGELIAQSYVLVHVKSTLLLLSYVSPSPLDVRTYVRAYDATAASCGRKIIAAVFTRGSAQQRVSPSPLLIALTRLPSAMHAFQYYGETF